MAGMDSRRSHARRTLALYLFSVIVVFAALSPASSSEEPFLSDNPIGHPGGRLVVSLRSEPKTLNPATSIDVSSREIIAQLNADLIHINRASQRTEPGLAISWKVSSDGLRYRLRLRRGLRFSDGHPVDADDIIFSFKAYLDPAVHSPQRDSLLIANQPIAVKKIDAYTVLFELARPYAAAERLFDSVAILPRHLLADAYGAGKLSETWNLNISPQLIAGLGPFRLKQYQAGQEITLERNPYYWKVDRAGNHLPYLNEITFVFANTADAETIRFQAGETDIINRLTTEDYLALKRQQSASFHLQNVGASLEFNFLFFNLNRTAPVPVARKQSWFREVRFRQAISRAIDREGMVQVVYRGLGTPLWTPVTPANYLWANTVIPHPARSVETARQLLKSAGFSWNGDGALVDSSGTPVAFTVITSASNAQRVKMATLIQADLKDLGIEVQVVTLEFHSVIDRIFKSHDYEAAVLGLGAGDVDPDAELNVWMSTGNDHVWDLGESSPSTTWEAEVDQLMQQQVAMIKPVKRKASYDRVQAILAEEVPIICLASPDLLVGAKDEVKNFRPAVLDPHTLWNSAEIFLDQGSSR